MRPTSHTVSWLRGRRIKAIRFYLLVTIAIAFGLTFYAAVTLDGQRRTMRELSLSNLRYHLDRVSYELEGQVWREAEAFLRDAELNRLARDYGPGTGPVDKGFVRDRLPGILERHGIVKHVFMLRDSRVEQLGLGSPHERLGITEVPTLVEELEGIRGALKESRQEIPDRVFAQAVPFGSAGLQLFYLQPTNLQSATIVFDVDLNWVGNAMLPNVVRSVVPFRDVGSQMELVLVHVSALQPADAADPGLQARFRTVLPYWQLQVSSASLRTTMAAARREVWFVGISILMNLTILMLGVYLLLRVSPELSMIQLQSEFVARVSHELRTPLTLIRVYAETLSSDDESTREERQQYCRVITRESERLSHLINEVLRFSSMDKKTKRGQIREGDLASVVTNTLEVCRSYVAQDGFAISAIIPSDLPPVRFDEEEVKHALMNLIENARKYAGDSRAIEVQMAHRGGEVSLEVRDYGVGIQDDERQKIFEPFYRARPGDGKGGWGLGLYFVRETMKRHGGRVELESAAGSGSTFRLVFPVWRNRRLWFGRQSLMSSR